MQITAIHHIQLAMPKGREDDARAFYQDILGLREVAKPPVLAARGGAWFEADGVRVHLGIEEGFKPAKKAHPAFEVTDVSRMLLMLKNKRVTVIEDDNLPGFIRGYVFDPFGNRIELLERKKNAPRLT